MSKVRLCVGTLAAGLGIAVGMGLADARAQNGKPSGNVEFIVPLSPGGGIDTAVRNLHQIIQKNDLVSATMSVVNKPGAGSSIGYVYLNQHNGSGNHISVGMSPLYVNALTGRHKLTYRDVTLIANLYAEYSVLSVAENSTIKSGQDFANRLRKDPASVSVGLTALGAGHHLAVAQVAGAVGRDPRSVRTVVFNSAGEAATAVRGGHIDAVAGSAAGAVRQILAGGMRAIAITAPERVNEGPLSKIPTWREQGIDVVALNWRGIIGPKDMPAEAVAYWQDVFEKVTQTQGWKDLLFKNGWAANFQRQKEFEAFVKSNEAIDSSMLKQLGFVKN